LDLSSELGWHVLAHGNRPDTDCTNPQEVGIGTWRFVRHMGLFLDVESSVLVIRDLRLCDLGDAGFLGSDGFSVNRGLRQLGRVALHGCEAQVLVRRTAKAKISGDY